jgi:hypothetical protein
MSVRFGELVALRVGKKRAEWCHGRRISAGSESHLRFMTLDHHLTSFEMFWFELKVSLSTCDNGL